MIFCSQLTYKNEKYLIWKIWLISVWSLKAKAVVWLLTGFILGQSTLTSYHTEANGYIFFAEGVNLKGSCDYLSSATMYCVSTVAHFVLILAFIEILFLRIFSYLCLITGALILIQCIFLFCFQRFSSVAIKVKIHVSNYISLFRNYFRKVLKKAKTSHWKLIGTFQSRTTVTQMNWLRLFKSFLK